MKVLVFIESASVGGAERMVLEHLTLLRDFGVDASFLGVRKGWLSSEIEKRGIPLYFIKSKGKLSFIKEISKILKSQKIDLLHTHSIDTNFYGAIAAKIANCSHLATEHGDVHHTDKRKNLKLKLKFLKLLGTEINAVSSFSKDKLLDFGISSNKISIIPNPVSLDKNDFTSYIEQTRAETNASPETFIWTNLANLRLVKDQSTLIKGFSESLILLEKETFKEKPQLWLIGQGELKSELQKLAESLGISDQVYFHGHKDDPIRYLAASNGFILSSLSEAMPMSLIEAASMELILVTSNVGGLPEIIDDQTGYIFEAKDYKKLGEIIAKITLEPKKSGAEKRAIAATKKIKENFSGDAVLSQYLDRYKKIKSIAS